MNNIPDASLPEIIKTLQGVFPNPNENRYISYRKAADAMRYLTAKSPKDITRCAYLFGFIKKPTDNIVLTPLGEQAIANNSEAVKKAFNDYPYFRSFIRELSFFKFPTDDEIKALANQLSLPSYFYKNYQESQLFISSLA